MRVLSVVVIAFLALAQSSAQPTVQKLPNEIFRTIKKEKDADTIPWKWKRGGLVNANLNQGSLSNWAAGGDNFSMAINVYTNYFIYYKKDRHTWDNNFDFNFGLLQSTSLGTRKNDDRIDALSKYGYKVDSSRNFYLTGLASFRSQLFDGNTYSGDQRTLASTFLSPAYVLFSVGMDYKPRPDFSIFLSPITNRTTFVLNDELSNKGAYGVDSGKHVQNELGAFASLNYTKAIGKNIVYKGRLDAFSNYLNRPKNIDIFMTNYFSFKINRFLSATYNLDIIYDDDVKIFGTNKNAPRTQLKSLIGIGFLMRFPGVLVRRSV